ncbi:MAG TPA: hypothetical protein VGV39_11180 [Mesorhizobium sp.]|jgi:hypothetical protein|nr:hypothetical protein [Mesorhizobium sp.]HEV2503632.1 hypothetical protein [Mesorhizobium sp.]
MTGLIAEVTAGASRTVASLQRAGCKTASDPRGFGHTYAGIVALKSP